MSGIRYGVARRGDSKLAASFSVAAPRLLTIVRSVSLGLTPQAKCYRRYAAKKRNLYKRKRRIGRKFLLRLRFGLRSA